MSWEDFDALCSAQDETIQLRLENDALNILRGSVASGQGVQSALGRVIDSATQESTWNKVIEVIQDNPQVLIREMDEKFFKNCPKPLMEELVAGQKSILGHFLNRINDPNRESSELDTTDIRLMHIIIDALLALRQHERLKRLAKMFSDICAVRSENGNIPGSVLQKLVINNIVSKPDHWSSVQQRPFRQPAREDRPFRPVQVESKEIRLKTSASDTVCDHSLAGQLKKAGFGPGNGHKDATPEEHDQFQRMEGATRLAAEVTVVAN